LNLHGERKRWLPHIYEISSAIMGGVMQGDEEAIGMLKGRGKGAILRPWGAEKRYRVGGAGLDEEL
jgi:hypothetical protein